MLRRCVWGGALALLCSGAAALSLVPAFPTPLDTVRLRYTHVGCTNADSTRVTQYAGTITVGVDRVFFPDCGTVNGYFEDFTLGRLPSGEYDVQLVVNPPPPTLGPSQLLGPIHLTVAPLPPTNAASPHDNYTDMWWDSGEPGWALNVYQAGERLIAVWAVYDADARPTWYALLSGSWQRDEDGTLHYAGTVYRTTGPYWAGAYDPAAASITAVGSADFRPAGVSRATFSYTIDGATGAKPIERLAF
jgi:hypothetical protein